MVKCINRQYLMTGSMPKITAVVIHNDAGSIGATAEFYDRWLVNHNKELGIAHYYIDRHTILRAIDTYRVGWHTGSSANNFTIGYEICQSIGASDEDFLANTDMTLRQVAEDMLFYNLPVNRDTVRLHREFSQTSCPHRSWELHGQSINSVKDYWIERIKYFQSLGKTVDEMLANEGKSAPVKKIVKTIDEVAREVLKGRWGNGLARREALTKAGYDYFKVQEMVTKIKGGKDVTTIAKEVLAGKWGNGQDRINRLTKAGYNPNVIQAKVNELI